ncbi:SRPBCC domain-containing protein [Halogeometricum luteum]|uniref:SRPBCC domain-containing protein n=1 Tax=Halogeometricum luteum TaxID=2950537 RepID=A0ABU2G7S5_9EURY|nr:SRPBCC domain-containing protein [Halogeometricum sp. S3BR5-2]MDS0296198.1 SRPBCC domain-containing protein [Halogeometricum sp. S3BR5-2]
MRTIRTEREIAAPAEAVWEVLTDLSAYREWNPHVVDAGGRLREGETVEIRVSRSGGRARALPVRVTEVDPPRRLSWVGRVLAAPLFEGRHTFELHELGERRTRLVNRETMTGLLVPLLVAADAETDYGAMNDALAARAEARFEGADGSGGGEAA